MPTRFYRVKALSGVWESEEETDMSVITLLLGAHPFPRRQSTDDMYGEYISPIVVLKTYATLNNPQIIMVSVKMFKIRKVGKMI